MYEERRDKFSIKDILIQVLFVAIFIFLLMWLFPMKKDVKNALKNLNIENPNLQPLYDQIFNNNVQTMKEAAISYYTTPRLPEKIGDEKKMTLADMLKNNLVLSFSDSKGKQCDLLESYVSITKMSDEYILKVNLKCSEQEDYILVHLGCYNYCDGGICEKKEETPVVNPTPTPTPTPKPVVNDKYEYEYIKVTDGKWGEYSGWSDWTKNVITSTDYRVVETKTENETTYKDETRTTTVPVYGTKTVQTGTKQEAYTENINVTKYRTVPVYETKSVQTGTKQEAYTENINVTKYRTVPVYETKSVQTGTKQVPVYETKTVQTGTKQEAYTTTEKVTKYRTERYVVKNEYSWDCTNSCKTVSKPVYGTKQVPYETTETVTKHRTVPVYTTQKVQTGTKSEPIYETKKVQTGVKQEAYTDTETVTKYRTVPVYETKQIQTGVKQEAYTDTETVTKYKTVPVYSTVTVQTGTKEETTTVKVPVVTKVTYYRSKTREFISGTTDTKWSTSQNDQSLLSKGYSLTGNSRKI